MSMRELHNIAENYIDIAKVSLVPYTAQPT